MPCLCVCCLGSFIKFERSTRLCFQPPLPRRCTYIVAHAPKKVKLQFGYRSCRRRSGVANEALRFGACQTQMHNPSPNLAHTGRLSAALFSSLPSVSPPCCCETVSQSVEGGHRLIAMTKKALHLFHIVRLLEALHSVNLSGTMWTDAVYPERCCCSLQIFEDRLTCSVLIVIKPMFKDVYLPGYPRKLTDKRL